MSPVWTEFSEDRTRLLRVALAREGQRGLEGSLSGWPTHTTRGLVPAVRWESGWDGGPGASLPLQGGPYGSGDVAVGGKHNRYSDLSPFPCPSLKTRMVPVPPWDGGEKAAVACGKCWNVSRHGRRLFTV